MQPIESYIAVPLARDLAHSALPDAPVVQDAGSAARLPHRRRVRTARLLRRVADRLEPPPCPGDRLRGARV
jgi:hypothetical protein